MPEIQQEQSVANCLPKEKVNGEHSEINGLNCLIESRRPIDPTEENPRLTNAEPEPGQCRTSDVRTRFLGHGLFPEADGAEIDARLLAALSDAGRSALGMPGTVDTFKAMLERAGLAVVLS